MSTIFAPLNEKKYFERIVDLLKAKIFAGEFRPGDRLPAERDLAEALKVSRLSVREAYRALQLFGMLEIRRGNEGGAFICAPDRTSIIQSVSDLLRFQGITLDQWNEARLVIELDIGRLAVDRACDADYAHLESLIEEARQKIRVNVPAHEEHTRFHLAFAELAANPILFTAYNSMMGLLLDNLTALEVAPEHSREAAVMHTRIVLALKEKNRERLHAVIEDHVREAGKRLAPLVKQSPLFNHGFTE